MERSRKVGSQLVTPLITRGEFRDLWEIVTEVLDAGIFQGDDVVQEKYVTLQKKLASKAGLKMEEDDMAYVRRA